MRQRRLNVVNSFLGFEAKDHFSRFTDLEHFRFRVFVSHWRILLLPGLGLPIRCEPERKVCRVPSDTVLAGRFRGCSSRRRGVELLLVPARHCSWPASAGFPPLAAKTPKKLFVRSGTPLSRNRAALVRMQFG